MAVVTGATGAIGGATALLLAKRGVTVIASGRDARRLNELHAMVKDLAGECICVAGDLTSEAGLDRLVTVVRAACPAVGGLSLLVHALGAFVGGSVSAVSVADVDWMWQVNAKCPFALTQRLMPQLKAAHGQVVFLNSTSGLTAQGDIAGYAASKFALRAMADALRDEVNPHGVRVLSVFPGRTASRMQEEVCRFSGQTYDPAYFLDPADVADEIVHALDHSTRVEVTDLTIRPTVRLPRV